MPANLFAECSDAGLCSLDDWRGLSDAAAEANEQTWQLRVGLDAGYALGDEDTEVSYLSITPFASIRHAIGLTATIRVPVVSLDGNDADASGLGDVVISAEQIVYRGDASTWTVQAGARLGTGDDNVNPNLPQAYQLGLGGTDIFFGLGWKNTSGLFASAGYAIAGGANDLVGTELERGDDVLFRLGYGHQLSDAWSLSGQAVSLYRLDESTVDDGSGRVAVADSDGLQINIRGDVAYMMTESVDLVANAAIPLLERDSNIDGLTRSFSAAVGLHASF